MRVAGPVWEQEARILAQVVKVARFLERVRPREHANGLSALDWDVPHVGLVSPSTDWRRDAIIEAIRSSIEKKALTVFAHRFSSDPEALEFLHGRRLDRYVLQRSTSFLLGRYNRLFPTRSHSIDFDATIELFEELDRMSSVKGHAGVSIVCDAPAGFFHEGREEAWHAFEEWWDRARPAGFRLVCVYDASDLSAPGRRDRFERTHPVGIPTLHPQGP